MDYRLEYILNMYPNAKCELNYNNLFQLLIAVVLSAQTTDKKVNEVTKILFDKYQSINDLANADIEDVKTILKKLGIFEVKSQRVIEIAKIIHEKYHDEVPSNYEELKTLPGVGNKTINVFFIEGLKAPAFPVDTHVNRVAKRLCLANKNDSVEDVEIKLKKKIPMELWGQMHHSIIFFGRYFCKAVSPKCDECALKDKCHKNNY